MSRPDKQEQHPVRVLQQKLDDEARRQARERYFAWRIVPLLAIWAAVMAAITLAAPTVIDRGMALTLYCAGAVVCVVGLSRRARARPRVRSEAR